MFLYYPVTAPVDKPKTDTTQQEDLPRKDDTDNTEVEVISSLSRKKEIPLYTVNSTSEGEDENTSFLCSQNSEKEDLAILRQWAMRKLKRLVNKYCLKCIKFSQKYFNISKCLANNPSSVTDNELVKLKTECLESLEACNVSFSSSSTAESCGEEPVNVRKKKVKHTKSLVQSLPMYEPTNQYNVAYQMDPRYSMSCGTQHEARKHLARYTHSRLTSVHHSQYLYSHTNIYNLYTEAVYSEYEHHQKSSSESHHQPQRKSTTGYPSYSPREYPQQSHMNVEIVAPLQRHLQATSVWHLSTDAILHRQRSDHPSVQSFSPRSFNRHFLHR